MKCAFQSLFSVQHCKQTIFHPMQLHTQFLYLNSREKKFVGIQIEVEASKIIEIIQKEFTLAYDILFIKIAF